MCVSEFFYFSAEVRLSGAPQERDYAESSVPPFIGDTSRVMFAVGKQTAERRRAWARPEYSLNLTPRLRKDGDAGAPLIFYFAAAVDKKEKWGPNYTTGDSCSRCPHWTCPPFPGGYASSLERKSAVQQKKKKKGMPGQGRVSVAWLSLTRPFYALHQAEGGNYWNLRQSTRHRRWYEMCFFFAFYFIWEQKWQGVFTAPAARAAKKQQQSAFI